MKRCSLFVMTCLCALFMITASVGAQEAAVDYILDSPPAPPDQAQVAEALACDVEALNDERYADLGTHELADAYAPENACDWGVLAYAYGISIEGDAPIPLGQQAFREALQRNSVIGFNLMLLSVYFGRVDLVPSQFENAVIESVTIDYSHSGLQAQTSFNITIDDADGESHAKIALNTEGVEAMFDDLAHPFGEYEFEQELDATLVQALASKLTDLLPIETYVSDTVCTDNYSNWEVTLKFDDGASISMITSGSNIIGVGGPWQTTLDGQKYIQYSTTFLRGVLEIVDALKLPLGRSAGMYCGGFDSNNQVIESAFGDSAAAIKASSEG